LFDDLKKNVVEEYKRVHLELRAIEKSSYLLCAVCWSFIITRMAAIKSLSPSFFTNRKEESNMKPLATTITTLKMKIINKIRTKLMISFLFMIAVW